MKICHWFGIALLAFASTTPCALASAETASPSRAEESFDDHRAIVSSVQGESRILKKDRGDWTPLHKGALVEEGDKIRTTGDALVLVSFDDSYLNILRMEKNTLAEFRSIEPTDIFLSDGSLFNSLEGLGKDSRYAIATPTAVLGVRGTSFLRRFDGARQEDETQVASGTVELAPLAATGEVLWDRKLVLRANQELRFDRKMLEAQEGFRNLTVLEMTPEAKAHLNSLKDEVQKALADFALGEEPLKLSLDPLRHERLDAVSPPPLPQPVTTFRSAKEAVPAEPEAEKTPPSKDRNK